MCARCQPEQFAHLRLAIVGAERLREPIAAAFKEKFGIDLLEGYGCTEMAPVVAVNVPDARGRRRAARVGRPSAARRRRAMVVDPDTGEGRSSAGRAAARERPEPDARLSRRAGAHRGGRCATAGM